MLLWHLGILRSKVIRKQKELLFIDLRKRIFCFRKMGMLYVHKMQKKPLEAILEGVCKKNCISQGLLFLLLKKKYIYIYILIRKVQFRHLSHLSKASLQYILPTTSTYNLYLLIDEYFYKLH